MDLIRPPLLRAGDTVRGLPVLANADFGHTSPLLTLPIGGNAELDVGVPGAPSRLHLT